MCHEIKNKNSKLHRNPAAFSLVEVMVSIILFAMLFGTIMKALTSTGTKGKGQLRTYSSAMSIASWYINFLESEITSKGTLTGLLSDNTEKDLTRLIKKKTNLEYNLIRGFKVLVNSSYPPDTLNGNKAQKSIYEIMVTVMWGNTPGDGRPFKFVSRSWKSKPYMIKKKQYE